MHINLTYTPSTKLHILSVACSIQVKQKGSYQAHRRVAIKHTEVRVGKRQADGKEQTNERQRTR